MESVGQPLKGEGKTIPGEKNSDYFTGVFGHPGHLSAGQFINNTNCQYECICNISYMPFSCISVYVYVYTCVNAILHLLQKL